MSESTRLTAWRLGFILGALAIVETSVRAGWISTFFLAAPTRAVIVLWDQLLYGNALLLTGITLFEITACLVIATIFGVLAGFLLWRYKLIGTSYEMPLAALFSSPVILAYPIFLVTFGRATRETACSCEVSMQPNLSQALSLINGDTIQNKITTVACWCDPIAPVFATQNESKQGYFPEQWVLGVGLMAVVLVAQVIHLWTARPEVLAFTATAVLGSLLVEWLILRRGSGRVRGSAGS